MIRVSTDGDVGIITLDRPAQRNALTPAMLDGLREAVERLGPGCGSVLVRGEGKAFCAGFDLSACRDAPDGSAMRLLIRGLDGAVRSIRECPVPVVVACQGAAIAGGCALVAASDFAVAHRGARLGYPVVLLGVSPAVSGPTLMPRIGTGAARSRMLDPELIDGDEALALGLVTSLVESPHEVEGAARRLALELAAKPRGAVRATKAWLNRLDGTDSIAPSAVEASLSLTGGEEERELLRSFWSARGR